MLPPWNPVTVLEPSCDVVSLATVAASGYRCCRSLESRVAVVIKGTNPRPASTVRDTVVSNHPDRYSRSVSASHRRGKPNVTVTSRRRGKPNVTVTIHQLHRFTSPAQPSNVTSRDSRPSAPTPYKTRLCFNASCVQRLCDTSGTKCDPW